MKKSIRNERGSLSLEQVLFIGAIVAMSAGLYAFYEDIFNYFNDFSVSDAPSVEGPSFGN